ncbi:MAG: ADP-ribosylglycohydrolase family protein [Burkholderiales bacterium]|nr:ADP-ribosylglycohydrolase family protein [Anaerolineae bacterium]
MTLPSDYNERVYAGWLGKVIGVRFGAPLENWTYEDIRDNLGELTGYLREDQGKIFKPDDDTAVPMILVRALEDYGPNASAADMGETWLNYLGDQHGTLWWGGYGVSTEHTAYLNLVAGVSAPRSGSIAQNGAVMAEQIGGQIFSDIWGWIAPNDPTRAADFAEKAASVSHDGNAIYGGRFIAALVSAAFSERDPCKLIDIGLAQIPADSEFARVTGAMVECHAQNPDDWRAAYAHLKANFGYDRYPGTVHIIPNAGIVAIGLLFGGGDFSRSIQIANMGGWDTDCNVGNVGAIMATALGLGGIDASWREPINDVVVLSSIIGTRNLMTIPQCADLFCALGRRLQGESAESRPRYHFEHSGSTNNFSARGDKGRPIHQQQSAVGADKTLQTAVRKLNKKGEIRVFTRTYYRPKELSGNYYEACFTPLIAPGQTITARVYQPEGAPDAIKAALYVHDDNHNEDHQATGETLTPGTWHTLTYRVPELKDACLSEVGIVLRNLGELWETGSFHVTSLDWSGAPDYETTFAKERAESGGISQWTRLRGYWRLEDGGYHGGGPGLCESYTGDIRWTDYVVEAEIVPLAGEYHQVNARVQGGQKSYAFGLAPDGHIALYKKNQVYIAVAHADFAWEYGVPYRLRLIVSGDTLKATITAPDGRSQSLTWRDDSPYRNGQIGLSTWHGGHMRCNWLRVRPLED